MSNLPGLFIDIPRNPILAVGIPVAVGVVNGLATKKSNYSADSVWYKSLKKPSLNPPSSYYGIVWPVLYASMGWASHLTVKALDRTPPGLGRDTAKKALALYWAQLGLNALWSPLFFGAGNVGLALVNIGALTGTVGYWAATVKDVDDTAGLLAIPYLGWLLYATYLNGSIWWQNYGSSKFGKLKKDAKDL
ncbi:related to Peripheral-type benzodiazepine receptor [Sporisorium reilianum SRZ2]|uniref:Related to Peripheral-type benzodiazepine receptor n=1 Tax=Sporisorium reilianum (strain SRZ2) TaxID=999809 RepID=E6ZWI5_SPORE|nr:related to Peripheral-type benzodiazepine receptor [Sporisorium reilianum SRZ2]